MIALLDTHSLLWAVSFSEISLKYSIGKLEMTGCLPEDLVASARQMGLTITAPNVCSVNGP